jgi:hypothetical protein
MGSNSPRFGHTRDFSAVFGSDGPDYAAGLVAAPTITALYFLFLLVAIVACKCLGKTRVGFLSGSPLQSPYSSPCNALMQGEEEEEEKQDTKSVAGTVATASDNGGSEIGAGVEEREVNSSEKMSGCHGIAKETWIRGTFVVCGIMYIMFAVLLVSEGMTNLQGTASSIYKSASDVHLISSEANKIVNSGLKDMQGMASTVRQTLADELRKNEFCPQDPTLQGNDDARRIQNKANESLGMLMDMDGFVGDDITSISAALQKFGHGAERASQASGEIDVTSWDAVLVLLPFTLVPCFLVAAAIVAHYDVQAQSHDRVVNYFLLPLFIGMTVLCCVTASVMIAAASVNSDLCLPPATNADAYPGGAPDTTILRIFDANHMEGNVLRDVANYYIKQCVNAPNPYAFLTDMVPDLVSLARAVDSMIVLRTSF